MDNFVFQNNIVWANDGNDTNGTDEISPGLGNLVDDLGGGQTRSRMVFCALEVDETEQGFYSIHSSNVTLNSSGLGSTQGNELQFKSVDSANIDYLSYLHIDSSSVCVDAGQTSVFAYEDLSFADPGNRNNSNYIARDFDNQLGYIDIDNVGTDYVAFNPIPDPDVQRALPVDIGADEFPTGESGFIYWWEQTNALE